MIDQIRTILSLYPNIKEMASIHFFNFLHYIIMFFNIIYAL